MPMRVIAKKKCRAMFESPETGERANLNPNLSTRLNLLFSDKAQRKDLKWCSAWERLSYSRNPSFIHELQLMGGAQRYPPYARLQLGAYVKGRFPLTIARTVQARSTVDSTN